MRELAHCAEQGDSTMATQPDATGLLNEVEAGDHQAADTLLELVYDELHELAVAKMRGERGDHTLQPTALVHEVYMRLVDQSRVKWQGRTHFKAVAAQAMHRVLVDHARAKNRKKRGGGRRPVTLYDAFALAEHRALDALALHDALEKMRTLDRATDGRGRVLPAGRPRPGTAGRSRPSATGRVSCSTRSSSLPMSSSSTSRPRSSRSPGRCRRNNSSPRQPRNAWRMCGRMSATTR